MTGGDAGDPRAAVLHSGRVQYRFNRNGVHDGPEYAPPRYVGDATVLSPLELLMPARISRPMFRFALDIDLLLDPELDIDAVRAALAEAQNSTAGESVLSGLRFFNHAYPSTSQNVGACVRAEDRGRDGRFVAATRWLRQP